MSRSLNDVIAAAAAKLMGANSINHVAVSERVLADLVGYLDIDLGFLRHNDHTIHATVLIARWPVCQDIRDPHTIGVVHFAEADSVFARAENLKVPYILRPGSANADYQRLLKKAAGIPASSLACVPLLSGDVTTGVLGFIKHGNRDWSPEELKALQAIATLFAQLQARVVAEEQVRYLAQHDDLTGLLNRRALIAHLDGRLAAGQPGPVAVLFLDVDRFKVVNDHLGQAAGDQFLKAAADVLREAVHVPAAIARFLGDAFVVVPAEPMTIEAAEVFALRLQERVRNPVVIDAGVITRSVSVGVAVGLPGTDSASTLLRRVDQATRSAKTSGGNTVAAFSAEMSRDDMIRNQIEFQAEGIFDNDSGPLVLHYLPEIDLRTGEVLGVEALVRWQHPTQGLLMPELFLGLVESTNLAAKLGRRVARSACAQLVAWRARGAGNAIVLNINVSPGQLMWHGLADQIATDLDHFGLDANMLCLDITENFMTEDIDAAWKVLTEFKAIGVRIAIDDFGAGYSMFEHLKSLPLDTLKIDKGFVRDLGTNPRDLAIVRSILALADALGLDVVAEGVETVAAAQTLLELGCYRAQGFLLSPPLEGAAMEALLKQRFLPMSFSNGWSLSDHDRRAAHRSRMG